MALNRSIKVPMPQGNVMINRQKGIPYVYRILRSYRNAKGQPTCDKRSIGRYDEESDMLIPNNAYYEYYGDTTTVEMLPETNSVKSIGAYYLFEHILSSLGVKEILQDVFSSGDARATALVAIYMACRGNVMAHAADWCETCVPNTEGITSQSTSALFERIGREERMGFFRRWIALRTQHEYLAYDVTSVSSYAEGIEDTEWGHNRDGEKLPQINLAMYLGQTSHLPVFYCTYPGSIIDKSYLPYMMANNEELGINGVSFVMDRGFCTTANITYMAEKRMTFLCGVEIRHKATREAIDNVREGMESLRFAVAPGVYGKQIRGRFYGITATMHIFFDPANAERQRQDLFRRVQNDSEALAQKSDLSKMEAKRYSRYHAIHRRQDGTFSYEIDYDKIDQLASRNGFFCLLTNDAELSSAEVLTIYRNKDTIEKGFDELKNHLDMNRLRTHYTDTTDGKVFCAFLSLIAVFELENKLTDLMREKNLSKGKVISELEKIKVVKASSGKRLMNPLTKLQKDIFACFDLKEEDIKDYVLSL